MPENLMQTEPSFSDCQKCQGHGFYIDRWNDTVECDHKEKAEE